MPPLPSAACPCRTTSVPIAEKTWRSRCAPTSTVASGGCAWKASSLCAALCCTDKQLSGFVPIEILKRYEKWKDIARISGSQGLRAIKGFHDEALSGEWKGHRSSRLGLQWRVIYQVVADMLLIQVIEVTADDYRRP